MLKFDSLRVSFKMFKRYLISVVLLIFVFFPVSAIELVFSATPELTFPFLTGGKDKYDTCNCKKLWNIAGNSSVIKKRYCQHQKKTATTPNNLFNIF